jgi:hypothetical protein
MTDWQPMETAPLDGNAVQLQFAPDAVVPEAWYYDLEGPPYDGWYTWDEGNPSPVAYTGPAGYSGWFTLESYFGAAPVAWAPPA